MMMVATPADSSAVTTERAGVVKAAADGHKMFTRRW